MAKKHQKNNVAIIGGSGLFSLNILKNAKLNNVKTPFGKVNYFLIGSKIFLNRHGLGKVVPPHRIRHRANIAALKKLGARYIFAFSSVGSLKKDIAPGRFLVPDDYINFDNITFFENKMEFLTPEISPKLRKILIEILQKLKIKFKSRGVYFQTTGPRFETKAEIRMIKNFADVVGMTVAKEATLAQELGIDYACLCSVDNFAHGLVNNPLSQQGFEINQKRNLSQIKKIIRDILGLQLL